MPSGMKLALLCFFAFTCALTAAQESDGSKVYNILSLEESDTFAENEPFTHFLSR